MIYHPFEASGFGEETDPLCTCNKPRSHHADKPIVESTVLQIDDMSVASTSAIIDEG